MRVKATPSRSVAELPEKTDGDDCRRRPTVMTSVTPDRQLLDDSFGAYVRSADSAHTFRFDMPQVAALKLLQEQSQAASFN